MKRLLFVMVSFYALIIGAWDLHAGMGDVNNDTKIDLKDVIISLQVCASSAERDVHPSGDADGDLKVGLQESIYAMRYLAGSTGEERFPETGNQQFTIADGDAEDPLGDFRGSAFSSSMLPKSIDYSSHMPQVRSQGATSSCTAWATGYYYKTYQEAMEEGWDKEQNAFSPMYLFAMQCRNFPQPYHMIRSWEVLKRYGCAKWSTVSYKDFQLADDSTEEIQAYADFSISERAHSEAKHFRSGEMTKQNSIQEVKEALTAGPVIMGINNYARTRSDWSPSPENNYLAYDPSNSYAGHAILCVGYDDAKFGTGAFKFVNSWGQQWAINGYSWIRYTDFNNIVIYAMTVKDLQNPNSNNDTKRPAAPTNVSATDNTGPYVDISWIKTNTAQYYRIYRAEVGAPETYKDIGTSFDNGYRDYPNPNVQYYYSVISVNDIGESDHRSIDTDAKVYTDVGSAKGSALAKPKVTWTHNENAEVSSYFMVANVDAAATAMEVFVSTTSEGPWNSFGWISPGDFKIEWGEDSEFVGKQPVIKVIVSNDSAFSEPSDTVQIGEKIQTEAEVADIILLTAEAKDDKIYLSWDTVEGGGSDFFDVWRYKASGDEGNDWIYLGWTSDHYYEDDHDSGGILPGISYYYAITANYKGTYGEFAYIDSPVSLPISLPNLYLYEINYNYGQITNPVSFELNVWNTGGTNIQDYTIRVYVYDWNEGTFYYPFALMNASEVVPENLLPLSAGSEHTFRISLELPSPYADGHYYSWIVEVDYDNDIAEEYEEDNWIWTNDGWWSYNLSPQPNIKLNSINYNYGKIVNPAYFELEVWNNGSTMINDYEILIYVYDWNEGIDYYPFEIFHASDVAVPGQLPLRAGYSHILSLNINIPTAYADEHMYYWGFMLDPYDNINELNEDDNYMWSDYLWWAQPGTLRSIAKRKAVEIPGVNSLTKEVIEQFGLNEKRMPPTSRSIGMTTDTIDRSRLPDLPEMKWGSSRPFSHLTDNGKKARALERPYIGPIRFKKPSFCIDRRK